MTEAVPCRLLLFNYNDAFDMPGELCTEITCASYAACAADSEIGGDIDAMDLPYSYSVYHGPGHVFFLLPLQLSLKKTDSRSS